jgi:hypothetical protein
MAYMTDETMDEFAQWQHDSAWESPEATDSEVIRESDIADCVHTHAVVTVYGNERFPYFRVWECPECGNIGEVGKEY